jgi:hypothetical protein
MKQNCSNASGLVRYEVAYGVTPVYSNVQEGFMNADGGINYEDLGDLKDLIAANNDNFYSADGENYSNFLPLLATQTKAGQKVVKGTFLDKKERANRRERRQARKDARVQAKVGYSEAQKTSAEAMGKGAEADTKLAESLKTKTSEKKGLSKNAKIGLIVGGVLLLGVVGFFIYKKVNKNN